MAFACRVFGHRARFWTEGEEMRWDCERGCGFAGSKRYPSAPHAARYAAALDREDRDVLGLRAPLSLFPLRLDGRGRDRGGTPARPGPDALRPHSGRGEGASPAGGG